MDAGAAAAAAARAAAPGRFPSSWGPGHLHGNIPILLPTSFSWSAHLAGAHAPSQNGSITGWVPWSLASCYAPAAMPRAMSSGMCGPRKGSPASSLLGSAASTTTSSTRPPAWLCTLHSLQFQPSLVVHDTGSVRLPICACPSALLISIMAAHLLYFELRLSPTAGIETMICLWGSTSCLPG